MKRLLKTVLFSVFFCSHLGFAVNSNLKINIITSISNFLIGEPIELIVNVTNIGDIAVDLDYPRPGYSDTFYNIINQEGENLPYRGIISSPSSADRPLKLAAGFKHTELIVLNSNYGKIIGEYYSYSILEPGEYTIDVKIIYDAIEYTSNILRFKVVAPEEEEARVYDSITKVFNEINLKDNESTLKSCNDLLAIIQQNPKSVYIPVILIWLPSIYKYFLKDISTYNFLTEKFITEYSWSGLSQDGINYKLKQMTNIESKKDFLQKIKQASKNSYMEKIIDKKLEDFK